ncbi:gamma-glutamyl-gamma-aminobutyrate hydrolase family protein [Kocuria flava]|uniref:gamma-glutamyl-gamma-aminobutyrate hydrolase family protein n=1 Tax=Kocuria flava TaxID=446860 RepID=UPI001FF597B0|nr:gamma-glutamyl-gamma-aminobutyrate hydrolase family protein [Kocuria flava]MCJ8504300.1 gamma-glutamyl-gamma-aminobutyrate hydrolase family protein [Kocuria flava]
MNRPAVRLHEHEVTPVGLWALRAGAPTVAVVVSLNFPGLTPRHRDLVRRYTRTALQALVDAGTRPVLVDSSAAALPDPAVAAAADGLLVLGGGDVDPALHGAEGPVPGQYGVDPRADRYTLELLTACLDRDAPLLALGRGAQLLNIACGGTLVPGLGPGHQGHPERAEAREEEVVLEPGSRLAGLLGAGRATVRSDHHQGLAVVGPELRVAAVAGDGTVEAVEHRHRTWVLGLQWHPEDAHGPCAHRRALFGAFGAQLAAGRRPAAGKQLLAA